MLDYIKFWGAKLIVDLFPLFLLGAFAALYLAHGLIRIGINRLRGRK